MVQVSVEDLFQIIGRQFVEATFLRREVAALREPTQDEAKEAPVTPDPS